MSLADAIQKPRIVLMEGVIMDRNELRRRQLGLDHYPRFRMKDVGPIAFAGLSFCLLWAWCRITGKSMV